MSLQGNFPAIKFSCWGGGGCKEISLHWNSYTPQSVRHSFTAETIQASRLVNNSWNAGRCSLMMTPVQTRKPTNFSRKNLVIRNVSAEAKCWVWFLWENSLEHFDNGYWLTPTLSGTLSISVTTSAGTGTRGWSQKSFKAIVLLFGQGLCTLIVQWKYQVVENRSWSESRVAVNMTTKNFGDQPCTGSNTKHLAFLWAAVRFTQHGSLQIQNDLPLQEGSTSANRTLPSEQNRVTTLGVENDWTAPNQIQWRRKKSSHCGSWKILLSQTKQH